jgi:phosphotransferase system HPr-like phosphotransfer protein
MINRQTTKLVQLKVKNVPKGAIVLVNCKGSSCPIALRGKGKTLVSTGSSVSLATLVKTGLKKGTTINVTISSPGAITAIKTLTVRKGKAPLVK